MLVVALGCSWILRRTPSRRLDDQCWGDFEQRIYGDRERQDCITATLLENDIMSFFDYTNNHYISEKNIYLHVTTVI